MLVFDSLKPRKFQIMEIRNNAKDDATGMIYTPVVCMGIMFRAHFKGLLYYRTTWVSLCSSISISHPRTTN